MKITTTVLFLILFSNFLYAGDSDKFFGNTIKVEGNSFVQVKFDRGGATNMGITFDTYVRFCSMPKVLIKCDKNNDSRLTVSDMILLRLSDVKPIYITTYWDAVRGNEIKNQAIAEFIADFCVNSGATGSNLKRLQRVIGTLPDGHFGVKTVAKINTQNPKVLFKELYDFRVKYYKSCVKVRPKQAKFYKGWINRINNLTNIYQYENSL